jgi:AmmeMemoRadiSam system protein A
MEKTEVSGRLSEEQGQVLVGLARKTIMEKLGILTGAVKRAMLEESLQDPVFQLRQGVFVTLHREGQLRGCIGSLVSSVSIADGVRANALNAAFHDFRFSPLKVAELDKIDVEVSILSEPQLLPYAGSADLLAGLRPDLDGVIIKKGGLSATFLPQVWKQLPEPEDFLSHLCRKAGLPADEWRRGELEVRTYQVQYFAEEGRNLT